MLIRTHRTPLGTWKSLGFAIPPQRCQQVRVWFISGVSYQCSHLTGVRRALSTFVLPCKVQPFDRAMMLVVLAQLS